METLKELNEYINKFLVNEDFLKIYNDGKPLEIELEKSTIYSNKLTNNHDLIIKTLKYQSSYSKFNEYKIKNEIIRKNLKSLFEPFESNYKDENGRVINFLNLHIYEINGNDYFLPKSHLNKFTMKIEEPLREQMNKKVPQISKKLNGNFKKDLISLKENIINEIGFDPKKLKTFKNGFKSKDINGIEKEFFQSGSKLIEVNDFYQNVKIQIDSLKNVKNIKNIEKMYVIIKPYMEKFNKMKSETKHVPAAPDSSKFTATVSGNLSISFNEWISNENKYSSSSYFSPLSLKIGGNYSSKLSNDLINLINFTAKILNVDVGGKHGTNYSTYMITEQDQKYTYENGSQSVSGKYVFDKNKLNELEKLSVKINNNIKNDVILDIS